MNEYLKLKLSKPSSSLSIYDIHSNAIKISTETESETLDPEYILSMMKTLKERSISDQNREFYRYCITTVILQYIYV